jgi:hypothetical protein
MKKLLALLVLKKVAFFAILFLPVFASAAPAYSAKMGQAISGVMEHKAIQRGFAANDPRFGAAVSATAAVLTTAATGAVAAAGAPLWVTIGLGALAAGAVSLALDAAVSWFFNEDGTVTNPDATSAPPGANTGGIPPYAYWSGNTYDNKTVQGGDILAVAWSIIAYGECGSFSCTPGLVWEWNFNAGHCSDSSCSVGGAFRRPVDDGARWPRSANLIGSNTQIGGSYAPAPLPGAAPAPKTPELAADDLTPEQKVAPVNPQIIADTVNQAWQQAASQPGYQGLPYSYTNPVTASDVEAWRASNPSSYPTVGDAVSPAINPSTGSVTLPQPGTGTETQPGIPTAPEGSPQLDLGLDPGIGAPNLEATPTGAQILAPITALFPDLRNFQVPAHQAECPRPVFDLAVIGKQVQMDAHCSLSEDVRGPLYNASLLGWVLVALFIVLSA